jgi:RNA polymerase sigma-70 factor (ECF subfamily)
MTDPAWPEGFDPDSLRRQLSAAIATLHPRIPGHEREDLVHNAMIRLLAAHARGGGRGVNASYVWRTAHSVALDELDRAGRRVEAQVASEDLERHPAARSGDPERQAALAELRAALRECLSALAADRRRAVVLQWLGHPPAETGRLLGWSAKRAANLCYRGLADLRLCLARKGIHP